jgi:predicted 2-oxoglutarate/Fe(II)-dependent dioxygenase YbiX
VDLDGLIGRLAERFAGSDELGDLTGITHNPTRMWSEL